MDRVETEGGRRSARDVVPAPIGFLGWCGTSAILGAYAGISFGLLDAAGPTYPLLNLSGACGVGLLCWMRRAWPAFVLEAAWALIAAAALVRAVFAP